MISANICLSACGLERGVDVLVYSSLKSIGPNEEIKVNDREEYLKTIYDSFPSTIVSSKEL